VPLGTLLSGGIDSSVITTIASRHKPDLQTFSIGYRDEPFFDETHYAEAVASMYKTRHSVYKLSNKDLFDSIEQILPLLGEPFADSSAIAFHALSGRIRQQVTVALSGDGADELFGGYNKYLGEFRIRQGGLLPSLLKQALPLLARLPRSRAGAITNKIRQLHRFAEGMHKSEAERYWYLSSFLEENLAMSIFSDQFRLRRGQIPTYAPDEDAPLSYAASITDLGKNAIQRYEDRKKVYTRFFDKQGDINQVLYADVCTLLHNDMLHKVDSMSMASALEVRVPFLDHRVVAFAFGIPPEYKFASGIKKRIVQDAFRAQLPPLLYKRPKQGFDVPLSKAFSGVLREQIAHKWLAPDFVQAQGIFDPDYIAKIRNIVLAGKHTDQQHVWALIVFQDWYIRKGLN
jgi:asparagine synthase (glutamine-hydrolysing)